MKYSMCLFSLILSTSAFAANSGGGGGLFGGSFGKGSTAWFVVGAGPITASGTVRTYGDLDTRLSARAGSDLPILGPLFLTASAQASMFKGTIKYNYTDSSNNTYAAQNVGVTNTAAGAQLGLQIRLINGANFHLFAEGGGFAEVWKMSYDFSGATNTSGSATAETSQDSIYTTGTYGQAGIDVLTGSGYGVRILARASRGSTTKIDGLNGSKMKYVSGEGYVGVVKQF